MTVEYLNHSHKHDVHDYHDLVLFKTLEIIWKIITKKKLKCMAFFIGLPSQPLFSSVTFLTRRGTYHNIQ